jgi:hypothetical protein
MGQTTSEQMIMEQEIAEKALNNAYRLIIGKITLEGLFEEAEESIDDEDKEIYLPFDPEEGIPEDCIEILLEHFIYHEEYEKCAELVKVQKRIKQNKKRVDNG